MKLTWRSEKQLLHVAKNGLKLEYRLFNSGDEGIVRTKDTGANVLFVLFDDPEEVPDKEEFMQTMLQMAETRLAGMV